MVIVNKLTGLKGFGEGDPKPEKPMHSAYDKRGNKVLTRHPASYHNSKADALKARMSSHDAVREWKKTGVKPKGLKKVPLSVFHKREE